MNRNTICTYNGVEIYQSDIDILCEEYENQYDDVEERINKPAFFTGLIVYINRHLFQNITEKTFNNDYEGLNKIFFDCFLPLCARYNRTVTLQNFCLMTGISNSSLSEVLTGNYRDGSRVNPKTYETCKKWKDTAEAALIDAGMSGNPVFSIFALKAGHSWRETAPESAPSEMLTQSTPSEIQQRYASAKKPPLPVFEDESIT